MGGKAEQLGVEGPRVWLSWRGLTLSVCAGALSEWLADHPVMINNVLPLVLQALGNPELSISSVSTLKKICRECKYDLPPYAANIVAVSQVRAGCGATRLGCAEDGKQQLGAACLLWGSCCPTAPGAVTTQCRLAHAEMAGSGISAFPSGAC